MRIEHVITFDEYLVSLDEPSFQKQPPVSFNYITLITLPSRLFLISKTRPDQLYNPLLPARHGSWDIVSETLITYNFPVRK
jgi:hypothetical protein